MQIGSDLCWTMSFLPSLTSPGHMPQVENPDRYAVEVHCHLLAALHVLFGSLLSGARSLLPLPCGNAPDLTGSADGTKDEKDGYSIVVVQATGHHTGQAFSLPTVDAPSVRHTQY